MAEGFLPAGANTSLDALVAAYPWIKLHVGAPGAAGTSNAATETTRKQATWNASSGGSVTNSNLMTWSGIAGSQDATHATGWSASTNGSVGWSGVITANGYTANDDYYIAIGGITVSVTLAS